MASLKYYQGTDVLAAGWYVVENSIRVGSVVSTSDFTDTRLTGDDVFILDDQVPDNVVVPRSAGENTLRFTSAFDSTVSIKLALEDKVIFDAGVSATSVSVSPASGQDHQVDVVLASGKTISLINLGASSWATRRP